MNEKFKNQATVTIIISLVIIIIALIYKIKKDNAATRAFSIKEWSDYLRNSSIDEQMEAAKAMPIPLDAEVADRLIEKRRCYRFKDSNGNLGSIGCKDSRINLKEIIEYYKKLNGSALSCGIRIYPAYFKEKHEMSFIIACTNGDNNNIDQGYTILKDLFYNGSQHSFQLTDSITHSEAKKLVREYKDNVWIKEDSLPQPAPIDASHKLSRFYDWSELLHWFAVNITQFDPTRPDSYKAYSIKFNFAYVDLADNNYFTTVYKPNSNLKEYYKGFTCVLSLYKDSELIDTPETSSGINDYKKPYLDIGHPCPPQCGEINWESIDTQ